MRLPFPKATTLVQQRQMQRLLTFVFLGVVGVTFFVLWQGFLKKPAESPEVQVSSQSRPAVEINFDFFKQNFFEKFAEPLSEPVPPQNLGRQNPFLPL